MVGAVVQLGVERDNAAIGVLQLLIQHRELLLPIVQLFELDEHLSILTPDFRDRVKRLIPRQRLTDPREERRGHQDGARQPLGHGDLGAMPRRGLDRERIHQAARAEDADAHARGRAMDTVENAVDILNARPGVTNDDFEMRSAVLIGDAVFDAPAFAVFDRIARDLGHGGGDARLILRHEAEQPRDLTRTLTRLHDVVLLLDRNREKTRAHAATRRTATSASSLVRRKSRPRRPAMMLGRQEARPG